MKIVVLPHSGITQHFLLYIPIAAHGVFDFTVVVMSFVVHNIDNVDFEQLSISIQDEDIWGNIT